MLAYQEVHYNIFLKYPKIYFSSDNAKILLPENTNTPIIFSRGSLILLIAYPFADLSLISMLGPKFMEYI